MRMAGADDRKRKRAGESEAAPMPTCRDGFAKLRSLRTAGLSHPCWHAFVKEDFGPEEPEIDEKLEITTDLDKFMLVMDVLAEWLPEVARAEHEAETVRVLEDHEAVTKWLQENGDAAQAEAQAYLKAVKEQADSKKEEGAKVKEAVNVEKQPQNQGSNGEPNEKRPRPSKPQALQKGLTQAQMFSR